MRRIWVGGLAVAIVVACGGTESTPSSSSSGGAPDGGRDGDAIDSGGDASKDAAGDGSSAFDKDAGGGCHRQSDCTGGAEACTAFVLPPLCGGDCDPISGGTFCSGDAECADAGANSICESQICNCPHGGAQPQPHCRKGCANAADCGPGKQCNATHRCEPADCTTSPSCGANYVCNAGKCENQPCATDADCSDYCVTGHCWSKPGFCMALTP